MYTVKDSGFEEVINYIKVRPEIIQPTLGGAERLCSYYGKKYEIDMRVVEVTSDLGHCAEVGRFKFLKDNAQYYSDIHEGKSRGLILFKIGGYSVPVIIKKVDDKFKFLIFDSTSGPCIKTYYKVAELFPEGTVYLNIGTRQADTTSCISDAICILKDGLRIVDLEQQVEAKAVQEGEVSSPVSHSALKLRVNMIKPNNFHLFRMPEALLKTAQRSAYLEGADLTQIIDEKKNFTLASYRDRFRLTVSLYSSKKNEPSQINSYLFNKSWRFKKILDAEQELKTGDKPFDTLPNEVTRMVLEHMTDAQKFAMARVCFIWNYLIATFPVIIPEGTDYFGPKEWEKHFGEVEGVPPLPRNLLSILESPCRFNKGKKVKETHLLTLIPGKVKGQVLTLNFIEQETGKSCIQCYYDVIKKGPGAQPLSPCWVLTTKECVIQDGSSDEQLKQLKELDNSYDAPNVAILGIALITHAINGKSIDITTRCQEVYVDPKYCIFRIAIGNEPSFSLRYDFFSYAVSLETLIKRGMAAQKIIAKLAMW